MDFEKLHILVAFTQRFSRNRQNANVPVPFFPQTGITQIRYAITGTELCELDNPNCFDWPWHLIVHSLTTVHPTVSNTLIWFIVWFSFCDVKDFFLINRLEGNLFGFWIRWIFVKVINDDEFNELVLDRCPWLIWYENVMIFCSFLKLCGRSSYLTHIKKRWVNIYLTNERI